MNATITLLENVAAGLVIYGIWLLTDSEGIVFVAAGVWLFIEAMAWAFEKRRERNRIDLETFYGKMRESEGES